MQTAFILMSILGCDDTATQCHHVEMLDQRWETIQACDAVSEDKLRLYSNLEYPVVVAVCQTPEDAGLTEVAGEPAEAARPSTPIGQTGPEIPDNLIPKADIPPAQPALAATETEKRPGLAARTLQRFKEVLPDADSLKTLVSDSAHVVTDSYSWVARRFDK